ncbi:hypothetical protein BPT24_260 [Tenacibaculum phage pT24]|uniref:Uncharacterized protein n=1 Tax=Tenacibaculum phage pT24 TaxID=1880590 RepID=A0A1B4XX54_9CAUD|nr:hypothetical protein HYP10_gp268 [Tenacibaculum phage pT24]BAV39378.1 hypothetical protein BPT24_260 [Tenacibaculum phage pT24]
MENSNTLNVNSRPKMIRNILVLIFMMVATLTFGQTKVIPNVNSDYVSVKVKGDSLVVKSDFKINKIFISKGVSTTRKEFYNLDSLKLSTKDLFNGRNIFMISTNRKIVVISVENGK